MPSDVMLSWLSRTSGAVSVPSGRVSLIPGSGPSGSRPHSWTNERSLSCATVSLNIVAKAETMSALRCRMLNDGETEVRSSEKHVSFIICKVPEDEHVVILCLVG